MNRIISHRTNFKLLPLERNDIKAISKQPCTYPCILSPATGEMRVGDCKSPAPLGLAKASNDEPIPLGETRSLFIDVGDSLFLLLGLIGNILDQCLEKIEL